MDNILHFNKPKKLGSSKLGKVKWWNDARRMGFVIADGEEFLITDKNPEILPHLKEGVDIRFVPYETVRGLEARDLELPQITI
ncbi:cold-shock protein [Bdellovibrio sp. HCB-162]|uniref:cold-shock protein n=1 Tax=Bdellovibrio sp. HCB-162 TaxID=3394234 RepID=UPI0039BCF05D